MNVYKVILGMAENGQPIYIIIQAEKYSCENGLITFKTNVETIVPGLEQFTSVASFSVRNILGILNLSCQNFSEVQDDGQSDNPADNS